MRRTQRNAGETISAQRRKKARKTYNVHARRSQDAQSGGCCLTPHKKKRRACFLLTTPGQPLARYWPGVVGGVCSEGGPAGPACKKRRRKSAFHCSCLAASSLITDLADWGVGPAPPAGGGVTSATCNALAHDWASPPPPALLVGVAGDNCDSCKGATPAEVRPHRSDARGTSELRSDASTRTSLGGE